MTQLARSDSQSTCRGDACVALASRAPTEKGRRRRRPYSVIRAAIESLESRRLLATSSIVYPGADGRLVYVPDAQGDFIPDFSNSGYLQGQVSLPDTAGGVAVPVKQVINPGAPGVDMTTTIQNAIDAVSALTPDANGFRGAIQLNAGNFPISGALTIGASGVVLIGQGNDPNTGTRLEATGTTQRNLITIDGPNSKTTTNGSTHSIQGYVPVGANSFTLDSASNLHVGDMVIVDRPSTTNWIHDIGMDTLTNPWTAGSKNLDFDRVITAINGNTVTIDAPLTNSLDPNYGGGTIHAYTWSSGGQRISKVGVMNMYTYSDYTGSPGGPDTDTTHATGILQFNDVMNAWAYNLTADNFATNVLNIASGAKWITVDHCTIQNTSQAQTNIDDAPSGISNSGQEDLISNCTLTNAYHAISMGSTVPGPSVYTNITITDPLEGALNLSHSRDETGPHQRWSTGGMFDDVSNTDWINIRNAGNEGSGHGWQGANYVFWNVNARTDVSSPPTAQNWVIGGTGTREGTGVFDQSGVSVLPTSLYQTQLWDRLHPDPTVVTAASATPNPLGGATSVALSVLGAQAGFAESGLTYTWTTLSKPNGASNPTFSAANGTNAGKNVTAALSVAGSYLFSVTIRDAGGLMATSTVVVTNTPATQVSGNVLRVVRNGTLLDVYRNNGASPFLEEDYASANELVLDGTASNGDLVEVDFTGGNPIPAAGLVVDGGGGTGDVVSVIGSSGADAVTLASGGTVTVSGASFGYSNFAELDLALGAGADTLSSAGNSSVATTALVLNFSGGGSLAMASGSTLANFADLNVNGATFDLAGQSQTIDALNGNGTIVNNGAATTLTVGQQGSTGNFTGTIKDGTGVLALAKVGAGTLTLGGNNNYSGLTTITGGTIASGNSASLVALPGTIMFNGGTLHVTANSTANNVANKFNTNTGFAGAGGSIDVDSGVTLTIGTVGGSANLRTNGGGFHGGTFTKVGLGTLRILSDNGQLDDPFKLNAGTVIVESSHGLGGADNSSNHVDMKNGTTLVLRQDVATNFLTPIDIVDANATINVIIDRQTSGPGVVHSVNAFSSAGAFTMNLSPGANVTSGTAGLSVGTVTLAGDGVFNTAANTAMTVTGSFAGAFDITKSGAGQMILQTNLTTATSLSISGGVLQLAALGTRVIDTPTLSITGGGQLDLQDNKLIVTTAGQTGSWNGSVYTGIAGLIKSGRNVGTWNGSGIITTMPTALAGNLTTLAVAKVGDVRGIADSATTQFAGQVVHGSDTIVMYTYAGDANLDGKLNIDDYTRIDNGIAAASSGWSNGDFDYDAKINIDDYTIIDANIQQQGSPFSAASSGSNLTGGNASRSQAPAVVTTPPVKRITRAIR